MLNCESTLTFWGFEVPCVKEKGHDGPHLGPEPGKMNTERLEITKNIVGEVVHTGRKELGREV